MPSIKSPLIKRIAIVLSILWLLYTVSLYFILPAVVKSQISKRAPEFIHGSVHLDHIKFNPYTFEGSILGLSVVPDSTISKSQTPVFQVKEASLNFDLIPLLTSRTIRLRDIKIIQPELHIEPSPDGSYVLQKLFKETTPSKTDKEASTLPNLTIQILGLSIQNSGLFLEESIHGILSSMPTENQLSLDHFELKFHNDEIQLSSGQLLLENFQKEISLKEATESSKINIITEKLEIINFNNMAEDLSINLELKINEAPIRFNLSANLNKGNSSGSLKIQNMDTSMINDYLHLFIPLSVYGVLSQETHWEASWLEPKVTVRNQTNLNNASINLSSEDIILAELNSLQIKDLDFNWPKLDLSIKEISIDGPRSKITMGPDSKITELSLLEKALAGKLNNNSNNTGQETNSEGFSASIKKVDISNGVFTVEDLKIKKAFSLHLDQLAIANTSTNQDSLATVNGTGRINDAGIWKMAAQSKIMNWNESSKLDFNIHSFNLTEISDYSAHFIGYSLQKGILDLNVNYDITESSMSGENELKIQSFELGEKNNPKPIISAPIPLAVSLLRDLSGNINLNVPVSGDLNDPSFRLSQVISTAFANIIIKVASAPFSIIGKLAGVSEESSDLSLITYLAGQVELSESLKKKINLLKKGISQRPTLILEPRIFISHDDKNKLHEQYIDTTIMRDHKDTVLTDKQKLDIYNRALAQYTGNENNPESQKKVDQYQRDTLIEIWVKKLINPITTGGNQAQDTQTNKNTQQSTEKELGLKDIKNALKKYISLPNSELVAFYKQRWKQLLAHLTAEPNALSDTQYIAPKLPDEIETSDLAKAGKIEFELKASTQ